MTKGTAVHRLSSLPRHAEFISASVTSPQILKHVQDDYWMTPSGFSIRYYYSLYTVMLNLFQHLLQRIINDKMQKVFRYAQNE